MCKNSKNMKTVKIRIVQKGPTNVCQFSQLPEGKSLDGLVIQLSRCLSGLVVIIMIGYGLIYFIFLHKKAINRKGQIYSNESTTRFDTNAGRLINSIHIFCVRFLTYHTSGKNVVICKRHNVLFLQRFCL